MRLASQVSVPSVNDATKSNVATPSPVTSTSTKVNSVSPIPSMVENGPFNMLPLLSVSVSVPPTGIDPPTVVTVISIVTISSPGSEDVVKGPAPL